MARWKIAPNIRKRLLMRGKNVHTFYPWVTTKQHLRFLDCCKIANFRYNFCRLPTFLDMS